MERVVLESSSRANPSLKGGPGQGKSTVGQYFGQVQRAAYILSENGPNVTQHLHEIATDLKVQATKRGTGLQSLVYQYL